MYIRRYRIPARYRIIGLNQVKSHTTSQLTNYLTFYQSIVSSLHDIARKAFMSGSKLWLAQFFSSLSP